MLPYESALRQAEALLDAGNSASAIEYLRDALSVRPNDAYPHLLLASALRQQRRLIGALHEAERALQIEPVWSEVYVELAQILVLQQDRKRALAMAQKAVDLAPGSAMAHLVLARIERHCSLRQRAKTSLQKARDLDAGLAPAIAEQGYAALEIADFETVDQAGREVLSLCTSHTDGLVLLGHSQLAFANKEEALRLALSALSTAPNDIEALHLLASVKMKMNPIGGLWWRWNRLLVKLGPTRAIYFVVGLWVAYRIASLVMVDLGWPSEASSMLTILYLIFVIYTLSADAIVRRLVDKEIETARINPDY